MGALTDQQQRELYDNAKTLRDVFAANTPNSGPGSPARVLKVLDGAMWNAERIDQARKIAEEAKAEAVKANATLARIVEHLGIDQPPASP